LLPLRLSNIAHRGRKPHKLLQTPANPWAMQFVQRAVSNHGS